MHFIINRAPPINRRKVISVSIEGKTQGKNLGITIPANIIPRHTKTTQAIKNHFNFLNHFFNNFTLPS